MTGIARPQRSKGPAEGSLSEMALYFLRLGALGFGGPVALANAMRRDLVEKRHWLTEEEYDDGLAISATCPGPLAYQLGVYCGYVRFGILGGLVTAVAFGLAPFLLVAAAAALYQRFAGAWQIRALFYGVAPVVVALILRACWNLGRKTLRRDVAAWVFFGVALGLTVAVEKELTAIFLVAGFVGAFVFAPRAAPAGPATPALPPSPGRMGAVGLAALLGFIASDPRARLFLFFLKTGFLVFGSGLVIVPFLKAYVVDQYHWLGNRAFLDAVAVGMISPGPVVITATFVGYLLTGWKGALAATLGIFTPAIFFTVVATPLLRRYRRNARIQGCIRGITVAVVGVLVGTTAIVARAAIGDLPTALIGAASLLAFVRFERLPEPLVVAAGGLVGLAAFSVLHPAWVLQ